MSERSTAPEAKIDPDYWDGHFCEDGCTKDSSLQGYPKFRLRDAWEVMRKIPQVKDFAFSEISDLIQDGLYIVQNIFGRDQFDANDFSEGTIIRFEQETLNVSRINRFIAGKQYELCTYYAMTANLNIGGVSNRVLVSFPAYSRNIQTNTWRF